MKKTTAKMVLMLALLAVLIVSVAGCTSSSTQGTTDYSSYYNSVYGANGVVVTPFYKTTSVNGNDLYIGVVRNFSQQSADNTITLELCTSQAQAAQIYHTTVTNATSAGYVTRPDNGASAYSIPPLGAWQGDKGLDFKSVGYYQDPSVGNGWVVETQYM